MIEPYPYSDDPPNLLRITQHSPAGCAGVPLKHFVRTISRWAALNVRVLPLQTPLETVRKGRRRRLRDSREWAVVGSGHQHREGEDSGRSDRTSREKELQSGPCLPECPVKILHLPLLAKAGHRAAFGNGVCAVPDQSVRVRFGFEWMNPSVGTPRGRRCQWVFPSLGTVRRDAWQALWSGV